MENENKPIEYDYVEGEKKEGIEETVKFLDALSNNIVALMQIDYRQVYDELSDLDESERSDIIIKVGELVLQILYSLKTKGSLAGAVASIAMLLKKK